MHPKSKDRSGNDKLISDVNQDKARRQVSAGGRGRGRQSPYARKLEAMRATAAIKDMIRKQEAQASDAPQPITQGEEE